MLDMNNPERITEAFLTGMRDAYQNILDNAPELLSGSRDEFIKYLQHEVNELTHSLNVLHRVAK